MKTWNITHKGHEIRVENGWFSGERLLVDGETQDEQRGMAFRSRLWGRIKNGDSSSTTIKVELGGWFKVGCSIFVDDKLVYATK